MRKTQKSSVNDLHGPLQFFTTRLLIIFLVTLSVTCTVKSNIEASASPDEKALIKLSSKSTSLRGEQLKVNLLLQAIGKKGNVNIVVKENVDETISLDLENIKLDDLFRLVVEAKELRYYHSNGAIIVEKETDFMKKRRDFTTMRLCPTYGNAAGHLPELSVLLSDNGSLKSTSDGNCLLVHDHKQNVMSIKQLLTELDRPIPQVHIRARIVTMDKSSSRELGVKWGYSNQSLFSGDGSITAGTDLSVTEPTSNLVFGFIRDNYSLDLELSALQEKNKAHLLSEPLVVVLDGQEAEIKQGKEIPFDSGTAENRNTSFKEAVLSLTVAPKVLHDDFIKLDVKVTNDSVDELSTAEGQPLLNRQEISTNLFLEDGVTVVIGGILTKESGTNNEEVPFLSDIPLLGELFKNEEKSDGKTELLVFLTPTILDKHPVITLKDESFSLSEMTGNTVIDESSKVDN